MGCISVLFLSFFFFWSDVLKELDDAYDRYRRESDSLQRRKLQLSIQRALIRSQELGDEKIQIAGQMVRGRKTGQKSSFWVLMCVLMNLRYSSSVTRTLTLINGFYGSFVSGLNELYVYIFWKSVVERKKKKNLNIYKTPAVNIK